MNEETNRLNYILYDNKIRHRINPKRLEYLFNKANVSMTSTMITDFRRKYQLYKSIDLYSVIELHSKLKELGNKEDIEDVQKLFELFYDGIGRSSLRRITKEKLKSSPKYEDYVKDYGIPTDRVYMTDSQLRKYYL